MEHYHSTAWLGDNDRYSGVSDVPALAPVVAAAAADDGSVILVRDLEAKDSDDEDGEDWFSRDLAALEAGEQGAEDRFVFDSSSTDYSVGWVEKWTSSGGSVEMRYGEAHVHDSWRIFWTLCELAVQ